MFFTAMNTMGSLLPYLGGPGAAGSGGVLGTLGSLAGLAGKVFGSGDDPFDAVAEAAGGGIGSHLARDLYGAGGAAGSAAGFHGNGQGPVRIDSQMTYESDDGEADGNASDWKKANNFLGQDSKLNQMLDSQVGRLATGAAASVWSDKRARRNTRRHYRYMREQGLTPWEIYGQGGSGGYVQSSGNTLGIGPAQQLKTQQQFMAEQQAREHENRIKVAQIQSGPAYEQAYLAGERVRLEKIMAPAKVDQVVAATKKIREDTRMARLRRTHFWQILSAGMSQQNIFAAMGAAATGLNPETILKNLGEKPSARQLKMIEDTARWFTKYGGASGEVYGLGGLGGDMLGGFVSGMSDLYRSGVNNLGVPNMER